MCDPVTIALIATAASAGLGAVGSIQQGKAQKSAANQQANILAQQAEREREIGALNASRAKKDNQALAATQRALLASGGRDPSSGSALLLQGDLAEESAFEEALVLSGADTTATRLKQQAALTRAQGAQAQRAGFFRAGSELLSGGANAAAIKFG